MGKVKQKYLDKMKILHYTQISLKMKGRERVNTQLLKGKLKEHALTQGRAAEQLGISRSAFNAKVNGRRGAEFSLGELRTLRQLLALSSAQVDLIFFG